MTSTRRNFIGLAAIAPFATLAASRALAADAACYDPAAIPLSQRNRRRAIGFVEASPTAARRCGGCAFFKRGAGDCGTCDMLGGGPVTALGSCGSFAPKAG